MSPSIGKITLFPYDFEPNGWIFCDGRSLAISEHETLFRLLGTTFGGDGESTFALPDLTNLAPSNCKYCIATRGTNNESYYEGLVGETMLSIGRPSARNVTECTGQTLTKEQAPLLMLYMGSRFGGNGVKNFNLPDMRDKAPAGLGYAMAVQGGDPNFARHSYVGELFLLPYEVVVEDLLLCNGSHVAKQNQGALYSVLGTNFGGDEDHFALPDLRAAAPPNYSYYISTRGVLPSRA